MPDELQKSEDGPKVLAEPDSDPSPERQSPHHDELSPLRGLPFPIAGIGASAGGLEAISALLRELPSNTGIAFIVVQHLDPYHESQLTELLASSTKMPVQTAENGVNVRPNHVYIIPPKADLLLEHGKLWLRPRKPGLHLPIDTFFESLARAQGSRAIGIVLSGNASDGSQGIRVIKGECGLTFAQDEATARHGGMPRNAIATGDIDFVLPPGEIARELARISGHPYLIPPPPAQPGDEILPEGDGELRRIFQILQNATKVDFRHYKQNTIRRRIGRRMIVHRTPTLSEYARYLERNPVEIRELYRDLLISVTNFFRDRAAFEALCKILVDVLRVRKADEPFRVWVPGCATGEEVYSLAIVLSELLEELKLSTPLQLFGTDISDLALERARTGIYGESIAEDVAADRLRRFFVRVDSGYQVSRAIREVCVFARQDLAKDPPFAHMDVITCRNVLIYMDAPLQRRILPVFHYSLNATGLLMLGSAETVAAAADLFVVVEKQYRIYSRKAVPVRLTLDLALGRRAQETMEPLLGPPILSGADLVKKVDRIIQNKYSPAAVVVDSNLQILHFRGHTSFYFDPTPGDATLDLLRMAREGLVVALRRNIEAAAERGISVREEGIHLEYQGEHREICLDVTPIAGATPNENYFLVVFDEDTEPFGAGIAKAASIEADSPEYLARVEGERRQLQQQMAETREYLRNLSEDYEASAEELRAANEEVRSANEELQSTNEELSTTKEELQSANEELTTVNEELQNRNQDLDAVNNDLSNLLIAVNVPLVMVDSGLRVRRFNLAAERLLELTSVDIGRPVGRFHGTIEVPQLENVVRTVLETLGTQQQEVKDRDGHWYSITVRPYRTTDNRIDGAVLVFIDIDPMKRSLTLAEEARDYAEGLLETVREPLLVLDADLRVQRATSAFCQMFHVSREETIGRYIYDLGGGEWNHARLRELLGNALFRNQPFQDYEVEDEFPHIGRRTMRLNARRIPREDGERDRAVLLSIEDVTLRQEQAEIRYQRLVETAKDGILVLDGETGVLIDVNPFFLELTGYAREDLVGNLLEKTPPFRGLAFASSLVKEALSHETVRYDAVSMNTRGDQSIDVELIGNQYTIGTQQVVHVNVRDITERRKAERARAEAEEALQQANRQLRLANTELEEFAYGASHDIQEPLRTIALYTELFEQRYGEGQEGEARQFLTYINQAVRRLQTLIGTLLAYTRATTAFEIPSATIDSTRVLASVLKDLKSTIQEHDAVVTHGFLPPVRMHEAHLVQIFQNLIGNAIKYRGSEPPRVTIAAVSRKDECIFSVTDNGVGIEPKNAKSIFGMFKRLHGGERPGTGIGLAICEKIISHYGGRIWVESVLGRGSTFFFSVPK